MEPITATELRNDKGKRHSGKVAEPASVFHEHMLGIVGIVGTVLNLLVVVFVYVHTPV